MNKPKQDKPINAMVSDDRYETIKAPLEAIARLIGPIKGEIELPSGDKVRPGLGLTKASDELEKRAKALEKGCFKVACVGFTSGGKTTLIESLQGRRMDSRATGIAATTGVITQTIYGKTKTAEIHKRGKEKKPETIPHSEFWQDYTLKPEIRHLKPEADNLKDIDAVLKYNTPIHRMGFSLVDTPGFALSPSKPVIDLLKTWDLDAVLLVLDSRTISVTPNREERLVKEVFNTVPNKKNFFLVINDFNLKDNEKKVLNERLRNIFKEHFPDEVRFNHRRRVFIVNAALALNAKLERTGDDALEKTGLPALERELKALNEYNLEATVKLVSDTLGSARKEILSQIDSLFEDREIPQISLATQQDEKTIADKILSQSDKAFTALKTSLKKQLDTAEQEAKRGTSAGKRPTFTALKTSLEKELDTAKQEANKAWQDAISLQGSLQALIQNIESLNDKFEPIKSQLYALEKKHKEAATELQNKIRDIRQQLYADFKKKSKDVATELQRQLQKIIVEAINKHDKEARKEAATELRRLKTILRQLKTIDTALTAHYREIVRNVYNGDLTPEELAARGL